MKRLKALLSLCLFFISSCASNKFMNPLTMSSGLEEYQAGNIENAKNIFFALCEKKQRAGCAQLASIYYRDQNEALSKSFFTKACELGETNSCLHVIYDQYNSDNIAGVKALLEKLKLKSTNAQYLYALIKNREKSQKEALEIAAEACLKKYGPACTLAGTIAEKNKEYSSALNFYEKADTTTGENIGLIGLIHFKLGDWQKGLKLIKKACALDQAKACRVQKLFQMQESDKSLSKKLEKRCINRDKESCYYLGLQKSLSAKADKSANAYFQKACELKNGYGCIELINNTLLKLDKTSYIQKGKEACDKEAGSGCFIVYENDKSISLETKKHYLEKGCRLNHAMSCNTLAGMTWATDKQRALKIYNDNCLNGSLEGCFWFIKNSDKSPNEVTEELNQICINEYSDACMALAKNHKDKNELSQAKDFYQRACSLKNHDGCFYAIEIEDAKLFNKLEAFGNLCQKSYGLGCYYAGKISDDNEQKTQALSFFNEGCLLDEKESCGYLGYLYELENESEKASTFYQRSCDLGSIYGCKQLERY